MQRRYVTTDVFTDRIFGGNPLAVVLDAGGLTTLQMQAIATEFNYSETTFVLAPQHVGHTAHVRIFTARIEVPFAGHPNIGTAVVLAQELEATAAYRLIDLSLRRPLASCRSTSYVTATLSSAPS